MFNQMIQKMRSIKIKGYIINKIDKEIREFEI